MATYRQYLQSVYDNSAAGTADKHQSGALLNVVGDDGNIDANYIANPDSYAAQVGKDLLRYYDATGITGVNNQFKSNYQNLYGHEYNTYGTGTSSTDTAADRAYLDDQEARLRSQSGYADKTLADGLMALLDSYNKSASSANEDRSRALEDFSTKREDTIRGKDTALDKVNTNARTLANSLRQKLGLASGSDSSVYQYAAPGAVARQAAQSRAGVVGDFGQNFRNLDTAETRAKTDFEQLLADLDAQRKQKESDFRSSILDKKNSIDTSLSEVARQKALLAGGGYNQVKSAMAPYSSAIDTRNAEIASLFDKYRTPYTVKAVDVQAPELKDYTVDKASIAGGGTDNTVADMYYNKLKKTNDEYSY